MNHLIVVIPGNNIDMISIRFLETVSLKGYLRYKTITFSSEAQVKNFFML